jgi:hypothetical protein
MTECLMMVSWTKAIPCTTPPCRSTRCRCCSSYDGQRRQGITRSICSCPLHLKKGRGSCACSRRSLLQKGRDERRRILLCASTDERQGRNSEEPSTLVGAYGLVFLSADFHALYAQTSHVFNEHCRYLVFRVTTNMIDSRSQ